MPNLQLVFRPDAASQPDQQEVIHHAMNPRDCMKTMHTYIAAYELLHRQGIITKDQLEQAQCAFYIEDYK